MKVIMLSMGLFISLSVYTYQSMPSPGYTGAPGNSDCSSCHSCTPITSGSVWSNISLTRVGGSLASITANASNPMNLSFTSATSTKFGFQLCVLPSSATSTTASVGTLSAGISTLVQTGATTSPARNYLNHTSAGTAASSGTASWNFNWITPVSYSGGATFYVVINETDNNSSSSGDQIYLRTFSTNVLPVRWLDFSAQETNDGVMLKWSTAAEINNQYFEIERSEDGVNFEFAGKVSGNGNTNKISSYSFLDEINHQRTWFYRLKQVDFDGKEEFSRVITYQTNEQQEPLIYTLGENKELVIKSENAVSAIEVFELTGKQVFKKIGDGCNQFELPQELNGVYLVNIQIGSNNYYKKLLF
jgi:hypothetical protein